MAVVFLSLSLIFTFYSSLICFCFSFPAGKRKLDGGNQNQGETTRRYQSSSGWGSEPLAQQPLGNGMNGAFGDPQWYQDSYGGSGW